MLDIIARLLLSAGILVGTTYLPMLSQAIAAKPTAGSAIAAKPTAASAILDRPGPCPGKPTAGTQARILACAA
ncbi:MAG: hypothetical protein INR63_01605 [Actinomycetospora chiangmaiensis]|jgi:hypothetical protein|nr:hypothetical protein [Actinomycetospora chiangmaiensis]